MALLKASPAALDLRLGLGLSLPQIAWISSIFTLATVGMGIFVGRLAQRLGARFVTLTGLALMVGAGVLTLAAEAPSGLLLGRTAEGFGFVLVVVAAPALMLQFAAPAHARLVLGIWATWLPVGGVIVLLAAPAVLTGWGWRGLWMLSAGVGLLVLMFLWRLTPARTAVQVTGQRPVTIWDRGYPWLLGLAFACFTVQLYTILLFAPTYLVEARGFSVQRAALVSSAVLVMAIPGGLLGSLLVHRRPCGPALMAICFVAVAVLIPLLLTVAGTGWVGLAALLGYGLTAGVIPPCIYAQAPAAAPSPEATGSVLGMIMAGNGLGILLGPPAVAYAVDASGRWAAAGGVALLGCAAGLLCTYFIARRG